MQQTLTQFAARLKQLRKQHGISQEDFAHKAGLHRVGYGWIEQQKRIPNLATLVKIAEGFGISLSELLRGVGPRARSKK
ncbi:MAG TPA: helix-turn-helix transcriptional regulator [Terriglobales bacterium]|nr:helix-turn-helix transcriptional regulator [Terriglobales bacterium]